PRLAINYDPSHFLLQQMDYIQFIDLYEDRIKAFHVKDAEFNPDGTNGLYGGYQDWIDRAGRFRSPGDGEIDFGKIFGKFAQYGYDGWAVVEWECCLKDSEQGASEGAEFVRQQMIEVSDRAFDEFANVPTDRTTNRKILGLESFMPSLFRFLHGVQKLISVMKRTFLNCLDRLNCLDLSRHHSRFRRLNRLNRLNRLDFLLKPARLLALSCLLLALQGSPSAQDTDWRTLI